MSTDQTPGLREPPVSRRGVLAGGAAVTAVVGTQAAAQSMTTAAISNAPEPAPPATPVTLKINGETFRFTLDNRTTLLDALREHARLTGAKKGCDHGQCGACTVLVEGRRINSCLTLAVMHDGEAITTIEGLGRPERLHPMQAAFVKHDGYQCGYCTPGQICSALGALKELEAGVPSHVTEDITRSAPRTADELRERMSGNICRCGAYSNIIDAVSEVGGLRA